MTAFRFLCTCDLDLGKPFPGFALAGRHAPFDFGDVPVRSDGGQIEKRFEAMPDIAGDLPDLALPRRERAFRDCGAPGPSGELVEAG